MADPGVPPRLGLLARGRTVVGTGTRAGAGQARGARLRAFKPALPDDVRPRAPRSRPRGLRHRHQAAVGGGTPRVPSAPRFPGWPAVVGAGLPLDDANAAAHRRWARPCGWRGETRSHDEILRPAGAASGADGSCEHRKGHPGAVHAR